jgi:tRNA G10  N-methylase Trm11
MPESLLARIIAVSSNPGDCVLDPFSGSGTTAAAAYQLIRNYVTLDISEKYVNNAQERLDELKKQQSANLFFNTAELNELKRLVSDIRTPAKQITADKNLLELVANQFAVRMNNHKRYSKKEIAKALEDIAD